MADGEMGITATSGGRKLTLDPIKTLHLTVDVREVESTLPCGLRVGWVEGEHEGTKFDVSVGAGMGNRWLTVKYGDRDFCMDVEVFLNAFLDVVNDG